MKKMMKKLPKTEKWAVKEIRRQNERFKETFNWFYLFGTIVNFSFPAFEDNAFKFLYKMGLPYAYKDDNEMRESIENNILQIHQNVLEGKAGNIEVRFDGGMIYSEGNKYELCNTIAMIRVGAYCLPVFFKEGDRYDAKIYVEDGTENAFLVFKDKDGGGDVGVFFLRGFYLFSIWCEEGTIKDTGIMIKYDWEVNDAKFDIVDKVIFSEVKELLVADWLQEEWKKTKEWNEKQKESMDRKDKIYT